MDPWAQHQRRWAAGHRPARLEHVGRVVARSSEPRPAPAPPPEPADTPEQVAALQAYAAGGGAAAARAILAQLDARPAVAHSKAAVARALRQQRPPPQP